MSGPWDRPPREPGADWPAEDLDAPASPSGGQPADDPWAPGDLWPEPARDASPGWDDWPTPPAEDDYVVEEPPPPVLSDPWAESWSDESSMAPAPRDTWAEPAGDASSEPPTGRERSPEPPEPPAPVADDANAGVDRASAMTGSAASAPLRPWSPDADPWGSTDIAEPDGAAEGNAAAGMRPESEPAWDATPLPEPDIEPGPGEPDAGESPSEPSFAGAFRGLGRAARTVLPDWLAEPLAPRTPARDEADTGAPADQPSLGQEVDDHTLPAEASLTADDAPAGPITRPEAEAPAGSQPEPDTEDAAAYQQDDVGEPAPATQVEEGTGDHGAPVEEPVLEPVEPVEPAESRPWWRSVGPWASPSAPEETPAPEESAPGELHEVAEPETPEEPRAEEPDDPPADVVTPPAEPEWPPEPEDRWTTRPWGSAAPVEEAPRQVARDDLASEDAEPGQLAEPAEAPQARWDDPNRPAVESTQVLPTSWAAPVPEARPAPDPRAPLSPVGGDIRTRLREAREADIDLEEDGEPEPTTAEQAVPWLIGFILLLAGMVIVLLALIFAGDESLGGGAPSPTASAPIGLVGESASASPSATTEPSPSPVATERPRPTGTSTPTAAPTPTPLALPEYGPLEMIYQGRSAALAPIYLLHREFTVEGQPDILAQDPALDVRRFAWAPDGTVGVGLYADVLVSVEIGTEKRRLGDGLSTVTFGDDAQTVYAVRVTQDGDNDVATALAIDFDSADTREIASVSYPRPDVAVAESLTEAQFADDGGPVRLYWMEDDVLRLWAIGGGAWDITPDEGDVTEVDDVAPVLWAPDRRSRIAVVDGAQSTLRLLEGEEEDEVATTTIGGLVSHLRWSPTGDRVVFTLARSAAGGGILQDLFLWDLADGTAPTQLTATGAAFGAEWRGSQPRWARG